MRFQFTHIEYIIAGRVFQGLTCTRAKDLVTPVTIIVYSSIFWYIGINDISKPRLQFPCEGAMPQSVKEANDAN
jgi:hypothetical protein